MKSRVTKIEGKDALRTIGGDLFYYLYLSVIEDPHGERSEIIKELADDDLEEKLEFLSTECDNLAENNFVGTGSYREQRKAIQGLVKVLRSRKR